MFEKVSLSYVLKYDSIFLSTNIVYQRVQHLNKFDCTNSNTFVDCLVLVGAHRHDVIK